MHTAASTPPPAPSRWPCIDLVEEIASFLAWSPNTSLDGIGLVDVVECGRGTVRIEIVDLGGVDAGILDGKVHGRARPVDIGIDHVFRVRRHAKAHQLGQDIGTAASGVLVFLKHQDTGAFRKGGSVAPFGEREAAVGREHTHCLPGAHRTIGEHCFRSARHTDVDQAVTDIVVGNADGMCRGGTRRTGRKRRPLDAVLDAHVRGCRRADNAQKRQRMGGALVVE